MKRLFIILILLCVILLIKTYNYPLEGFASSSNNYEIDFDDTNTKPIKLYNITHRTVDEDTTGFRMNGVSGYIELPDISKSPYTLSFLLYLESASDKIPLISSDGFSVDIQNNKLAISQNYSKYVFDKELSLNTYHHIALKVSDKSIIVFFKGVEFEYSFSKTLFSSQLFIGTNKDKNKFIKGTIAEIKLYSSILTSSMLCKLHDACLIGSCSYTPAGSSRDECYKLCMESNDADCNDEACFNKCHNTLTSKWTPPCDFEPYGDDIFNCVNTCVTKSNCDYSRCKVKCESCKNVELCPWLKANEEVEDPNPFKPVETSKLNGEPIAPFIRATPYNGKIELNWIKPKTYEEQKGEITAYVAFVFKTLNKNDGIVMSKVPFPRSKKCKHIITDLDEDIFYSVGIRAYNSGGLSKMSNIVSLKPKYKSLEKPRSQKTVERRQTEYISFCN